MESVYAKSSIILRVSAAGLHYESEVESRYALSRRKGIPDEKLGKYVYSRHAPVARRIILAMKENETEVYGSPPLFVT